MVNIGKQDIGIFFRLAHNRLSIISISENLGPDYESLYLFDRNYATFFLMYQLRVTIPHDWQVG